MLEHPSRRLSEMLLPIPVIVELRSGPPIQQNRDSISHKFQHCLAMFSGPRPMLHGNLKTGACEITLE